MSFSKTLARIGLVTQLGNAIIAGLTIFAATPGVSTESRAKALLVHGTIASVVGTIQSFLRSVRDENNNGIPDDLESPPTPPAT